MSICLVSTICLLAHAKGYGNIIGIDVELVVPNTYFVYENVLFP
jgi:hypothetical protein